MNDRNDLLAKMEAEGFEDLVLMSDASVGLKGVIAIHDTTLGPGFGGTRIMPYPNEIDAILDAMRLAKAMTYKNAAAGLDFGGGKAVLIGDPSTRKTEPYLRAFGRQINGLGGRYVTGVDVGTDSNDMIVLQRETPYVVALPEAYGGCGDTPAATAFGLYTGMKRAAELFFGDSNLGKKTVAVQGAGHIGSLLLKYLADDGAKVYVADVNSKRTDNLSKENGVTVVSPEDIYDVECDIFSPNALGGILNDESIPRLKCKLIAGAANNQLQDVSRHSTMLKKRGIMLIPDFILSAGGVILNSFQFSGCNKEKSYNEIRNRVASNVEKVMTISDRENITPHEAAIMLAQERIRAVHQIRKFHLGNLNH